MQAIACNLNYVEYSQALRYRMIITKDDMLKEELKNLATVLTHRGYPNNLNKGKYLQKLVG